MESMPTHGPIYILLVAFAYILLLCFLLLSYQSAAVRTACEAHDHIGALRATCAHMPTTTYYFLTIGVVFFFFS
jgi:hypothetical protein